MEKLLQKNERRQLRLAEFLIQQEDWVTFEELSEELNYSERILKYDIDHFKEIHTSFKIESSVYGIRLVFNQNKGFKNIYHNIFKSSDAFQLLELLFFNEDYSIDDLANKLYISSSTLYRLINRVNEVIIDYGFQIERNPCRIVGEEDKIRYFYYQYFFEKYTVFNWPYNQINHDIVHDLLNFFINLTDFNAGFAYYNIAKLILFINFNRYQNGYFIENEAIKIDEFLLSMDIPNTNIHFFEKKYRLKIDRIFLGQIYSPFVQTAYFFNYETLIEASEKNKNISIQIQQLENLILQISKDNNIPIKNKENLILELYNAQLLENYDPRSGSILYDRNKLFLNKLKNDYPHFYQSINHLVREFRTKTGADLDEKNVNYMLYTLVVEWTSSLPTLVQNIELIKVLILSNRTLSHSNLLKNILEAEFPNFLQMNIFNGPFLSVEELEKSEYEFIISNFPIPKIENTEIFYIENFPVKSQLLEIQKKINSLHGEINQ